MLKIYVAGEHSYEYANWILESKIVHNIEDAGLVLFTGGEDVSPDLYGEPAGRRTYFNRQRDRDEKAIFDKALELGLPMLGICRGSQLGCVLSGGRLVQDQQNLFSLHNIKTSDGRNISISSTHHQAQYPYDMKAGEYQVLAWTDGISKYHLDGYNKEMFKKETKEVEICYYPKTRFLGIQGHPEYLNRLEYDETFAYLDLLLEKLLSDSFEKPVINPFSQLQLTY